MVYTTRFTLSPASIDPANYQLFAPVLGAVRGHVVEVTINGVLEHDGFWVPHPWLVLDRSKLGYRPERTDKISLRVEYFYKAENPGLLAFLTGSDPAAPDRRTEIMSKHYIDGHFALDNGLHKEAVLNFGTVVEPILNHDLSSQSLAKMINTEVNAAGDEAARQRMHTIRELRNRVHPGRLRDTEDVTKYEATQAKLALQEVILFYMGKTVSY